jgi:hypothetical protein
MIPFPDGKRSATDNAVFVRSSSKRVIRLLLEKTSKITA